MSWCVIYFPGSPLRSQTLTVSDEPFSPGRRIVRSDLVVTVVQATSVVLLDMGGGRRLTLDSFGSRVWRLLEDQPTLPLLLQRLRDDQVPDRLPSADIRRLIARWEALGVISWR